MKTALRRLLPAAAISLTVCCSPEKTPAELLMDRLEESVKSGVIMYGHQDDLVYGHTWQVLDAQGDDFSRSDVLDVAGSYPAVLGLELGELELGGEKNLDTVPFDVITRAAQEHYARGGIVTFSWHPRNPLTGGTAWDVSSDKAVESILEGGQKRELFLKWLQMLGDFFDTIRTPEGERIPFIFRPWHEHTGSWFWWGRDLCTTEQFVTLFRQTREYLEIERGMDNILWCYSPNLGVDADGYMERWPGDDVVDIMGFDCYAFLGPDGPEAASKVFNAQLNASLAFVRDLGLEHGKMITLSETGFQSIPDPKWWTQALYPAIKDYPIAYVLTWRNAPDDPAHFYAPWKGFENAQDFVDFTNLEQIKLL
ncbi:MAG: beta-mannosidase [Bacteroidales bacterium]|nr:beta-mannosidase [Bacteroidales bacterium]